MQLEFLNPIVFFTIIWPDKSREILNQYYSCQWLSRTSDKEPPRAQKSRKSLWLSKKCEESMFVFSQLPPSNTDSRPCSVRTT